MPLGNSYGSSCHSRHFPPARCTSAALSAVTRLSPRAARCERRLTIPDKNLSPFTGG